MLLNEILPVYKREMKAYAQSPATYVVLGLFMGFVGLMGFHAGLTAFVEFSHRQQQSPEMGTLNLMQFMVSPMFMVVDFMMLFTIPILTMRLFSEEKRLGSFELLVTCPLKDWSILLGKFFAALTVGWIALALTLVYPAALRYLADKGSIEVPVLLVSFLGSALVIAAFVAFGVFASSVTENQMLAAILTFVGLFTFWLVGRMPFGDKEIWHVQLKDVLSGISIYPHVEGFSKGLINLTDLVYFVLFSAFFLILTSKILEARRWRV